MTYNDLRTLLRDDFGKFIAPHAIRVKVFNDIEPGYEKPFYFSFYRHTYKNWRGENCVEWEYFGYGRFDDCELIHSAEVTGIWADKPNEFHVGLKLAWDAQTGELSPL